jgi:translin
MSLEESSAEFRRRFDEKMSAREKALPAARRAVRSSANAIRAIHRREWDEADRLMGEARAALDEGVAAVREHPDIRHAGFLHDAEKEYAEARLTEAVVRERELPGPDELRVDLPAYLVGMSEAIGEARRWILDLLRRGEHGRGEAVLSVMDDMYYLLVSMDYPDAITANLRRSTDVARGILERTRGDLTVSLVQKDLKDTLERHTPEVPSAG